MQMLKTTLVGLLAVVAIGLGLAGCGGSGNTGPTADTAVAVYRVAFQYGNQINTMDPNGTNVKALTIAFSGDESWPSWSRDGSKIAFVGTHDRASGEIYVMNANGTNKTRVTNDTMRKDASCATWSPDGHKLIYSASPGVTGLWYLYSINLNGTARTKLTSGGSEDGPSWSPNGAKIVYSSQAGVTDYQLWTMNPDGSGKTRLTNFAGWDRAPRWSPDGKKIAFSRDISGNKDICTINADGTNPQRLTTDSGYDTLPSWSPGGGQIVFSRLGTGLLKMKSDGNNQVIVKASTDARRPSWGRG